MKTFTTALFLAALLTARLLFAQNEVAQAEKLFQEGLELMERAAFAEACEKFEASQELDPLPSTLLNLAHCREKNGQFATAWNHFLKVKIETEGIAKYQDFNKGAKARASRLEDRVSYLAIMVPDDNRVPGLTISSNGREVSSSLWNQSLPVDGGNYEIEGKAPGHEAWSTTVTVEKEKDNESITVPRFKAVLETDLGGSSPESTPLDGLDSSQADKPSAGMTPKRKLALGIGAAGILALGSSAFLEVKARGTYDDARDATDDDTRRSLEDDAVRQRSFAVVAGVIGAAAVTTAVYLWITGASKPARNLQAIAPSMDGESAVVTVTFDMEWL